MLCENLKSINKQIINETLDFVKNQEQADIVIYSDGSHSYHDNYTGIAAVVVNTQEQKVTRVCAALNVSSNTMAELHAMLLGLEEADNLYNLKKKKVICFIDRSDFSKFAQNRNLPKAHGYLRQRLHWFLNNYRIKLIVQKRNTTAGMTEADNFAYEMRACIRDHLEALKNSSSDQ